MFLDASIQLSTAQSMASSATTALVSTVVYDVTGAGIGVTPSMIGGQTSSGATKIGFDIGAGDGMTIPEVFWNVGTTFVGGTATLQVKLQAAEDNGSNQPSTWVDLYASQLFTLADLPSGTSNQFQVPPVPSDFGLEQPRFYRLLYGIATATFSAGAITANIVLNPAQAAKIQNYPSNYIA